MWFLCFPSPEDLRLLLEEGGSAGKDAAFVLSARLRWKFLLLPSAPRTDLFQERSRRCRLPLAPSLSGSCSAAATKFTPRKGNSLMQASTPELAGCPWHRALGWEDVAGELQQDGCTRWVSQLLGGLPLQGIMIRNSGGG